MKAELLISSRILRETSIKTLLISDFSPIPQERECCLPDPPYSKSRPSDSLCGVLGKGKGNEQKDGQEFFPDRQAD
jgi:hypothetical protein